MLYTVHALRSARRHMRARAPAPAGARPDRSQATRSQATRAVEVDILPSAGAALPHPCLLGLRHFVAVLDQAHVDDQRRICAGPIFVLRARGAVPRGVRAGRLAIGERVQGAWLRSFAHWGRASAHAVKRWSCSPAMAARLESERGRSNACGSRGLARCDHRSHPRGMSFHGRIAAHTSCSRRPRRNSAACACRGVSKAVA